MPLFLLRRLGAGVVLVFVMATLTFFLTSLTGSDPARRIARQPGHPGRRSRPSARELGLDRPVLSRYCDWLSGAVHGDLGSSWFNQQPVTRLIGQCAAGLAVAGARRDRPDRRGERRARRRGRRARRLAGPPCCRRSRSSPSRSRTSSSACCWRWSSPCSWGCSRPLGYIPFADDPGRWLASITLPAIALAIGAIATVATQTRGSMIDVLQQDYVRTLRSRGLPTRSLLLKHALRNAAPAVADRALAAVHRPASAAPWWSRRSSGSTASAQRATSAASQGDVPLVLGIVVVTVRPGRHRQPAASTSPSAGSTPRCASHEHPRTEGGAGRRHRRPRADAAPPRRARRGAVRRLLRNPVAVVSLGWLALVAVLAAASRPLLTSRRARRPRRSPTPWRRWAAPTRSAPTASAATCCAQLLYGGADQPDRRAHRRGRRRSSLGSADRASWPATTGAGSTRRPAGCANLLMAHAGDHRAAGRAGVLRPQHRTWPWLVFGAPHRARGVPADPGVGDRRARGALRRRGPGLRARRRAHHAAAHPAGRRRRPRSSSCRRSWASPSSSRPGWSSSASARRTRPAGAGCSATPSRTSTPSPGCCCGPAWRSC